jgi:hypothetical protein
MFYHVATLINGKKIYRRTDNAELIYYDSRGAGAVFTNTDSIQVLCDTAFLACFIESHK